MISIVPKNPCYWILSIFRSTSKNYHVTGIVVGRREQFFTCLGSSQFWSSSRHQMLLGSLNDNCIFVLRIRWLDLRVLSRFLFRSMELSIHIYIYTMLHDSQDESIVLSEPPTNWYLPSSGFLRWDDFLTEYLFKIREKKLLYLNSVKWIYSKVIFFTF
jgi:hypothetical protein